MAKKNTPPPASEQVQPGDQLQPGEKLAPIIESMHPQVGDTVLFVLPEHDTKGRVRPAIVVQVFKRDDEGMPLINMQQFTDGLNDITDHPVPPGSIWRTSVHHDQTSKQPGTWHWPSNEG